ncbi:MAG: DNRLRE domain-containing protein [Clostridia bacterium]|nr:DNRLRE domain-containing protein [Clostridia bacterium]
MSNITVNIPDTTFVSSALATSNLSFYPTMYAGTDASYLNCITLMNIILPTLPVTHVDSATLNLAVITKTGVAPSPIIVNQVTSAFDASTVTYNTMPSFTPTASGINITDSDLYAIVQIDVTPLINGWLDGSIVNDGIALTNSDGTTVVVFTTDNIGYAPYFPTLNLTYTVPPVYDSAICFSYEQLANLITQLMTLYPATVMTIYTTGFNVAGINGIPVELYASPDATYGTLAVLTDEGSNGIVPLNQITAIALPDGTVYDPTITYLPVPNFYAGCDKNLITSWHDYFPLSTPATVYAGALISETGIVYKNEYGLLIMADDVTGLNPVFMPVINITCVTTAATLSAEKGVKTSISPLLISGGETEIRPNKK